MTEDDLHIIEGPQPQVAIENRSMGQIIYENLLTRDYDGVAMIEAISGSQITYKQILRTSCSLAESLTRNNFGKHTMMAICSQNIVEFFNPVLATLFVGGTLAPLNPAYTEHELTHVLNLSRPQLVFCSKLVLPKFLKLKAKLAFLEKILVIDSEEDLPEAESLTTFIRRSLHGVVLDRFQPVDVDVENHVALIMCSSGTTGLPKGCMITHKNLLARNAIVSDPRFFPVGLILVSLCIVPFYHAYGLMMGLGALKLGVQLVTMSRFDERVFLKTIQDYQIMALSLVPPLAVFLAKSPLVKEYDLSSVRYMGCGAAPLSTNIEEMLTKKFNVEHVHQGYGMTEVTLGVTGHEILGGKSGSVGKILPHMKAKVRDVTTGKSLGPGQVGELCFKGPLIMKGYYRNELETKNTITEDGWLLTGDLGYYDEDQDFYFVDRQKELIKYKGFQVPPAELELLLLDHLKIVDVGVVGLPVDEAIGEVPVAFVVKDPKSNLTEKEVEDYVAKMVSPHKKLRGGVIFVNSIPKNPSGKILRKELRNMLKERKSKL